MGIEDSDTWLLMLKKRNTSTYIYDKDEADKTLLLISDRFIPAFNSLEATLKAKLDEVDDEWL